MSDSEHATPTTEPIVWIWALTLMVAGLPVAFGLYQVWIYFDEAFPHLYWSRTLPALIANAVVVVGVAVPLWILIKKRTFCSWRRGKQWRVFAIILLLMSLAYVAPFVLLAEVARRSPAILPYTPSVFLLKTQDGETRELFSFGVVGGPGTGYGRGHTNRDRVIIEWNAPLEPAGLSPPQAVEPFVKLRGEAPLNADPMQIDVQIETGRLVRFDTRGFDNLVVKQNDQQVRLPIELAAGTHRFNIRADAFP